MARAMAHEKFSKCALLLAFLVFKLYSSNSCFSLAGTELYVHEIHVRKTHL